MSTNYKGGYMGLVMEYNLSTGEAKEYPWTDEDRAKYIGGKTMATKIMYDYFTGNEKPFGEENIIIIATGPLTGTGAPSSGRFDISTLSPQTGITTSSNCGGRFGYYLKKAGIDALIIRGKAAEHSWLEIRDSQFILHNADDDGLWGLKTGAAQERLSELMTNEQNQAPKFAQVVIGPAGENLVLYSSVISDERAAGRGGTGAVFGSKNLKAIVACGNKDIPVCDSVATKALCQKWFKYLKEHPFTGKQLPELGTASLVSMMQNRSMLSTKNYNYGKFDQYEKVSGETLAEKYNIINKGCLSCSIRCARTVEVDGKEVKGPELETLGLLSAGILNDDITKVFKWNYELDELGMDTISTSSTLAWAMEANEKGLWDNGLEFGKTDNISQILNDIAYRKGIGNELADGSKRISAKYGGEEFAIQSKGLELAAYEPRRAVGQGLGYAVSNRGGCHLNGGYMVIVEGLGLFTNPLTPKAKADFTMIFQDLMETMSASGQCLFTSYAFFPSFLIKNPNGKIATLVNKSIPHIGWLLRVINRISPALAFHLPVLHHTKIFKPAIGMPMTLGKYMRCGERSYTLERALNVKFGVNADADTLPKRLTDVPQDPENPDTLVPLEKMKKTYYRARGWDQNGIPRAKTLRKLKLL